MSHKIYLGLIAGVLAGIAIPVILKIKEDEELFSGEDLSDENTLLEKANSFLINAREQAGKLIDDAEERSHSLVEQAGRILSSAKEKTSMLHELIRKGNEKDLMMLKESIEEDIREFSKVMSKEQ